MGEGRRFDLTGLHEIEVRDVEYRRVNGHPLLARVYQPRGKGPFPALISLHGGAWTNGDRTDQAWVCEPLAASGVTVLSLDFRLAPAHPYPEPLSDINYGIRWVKAHASDFSADPGSLGALGSSTGGHHGMLAAMRPGDPRYASVPLQEAPDIDATLNYVVGSKPILDPFSRYLFAQETGREDLVTRTEGYFGTQEAMQEGNPQMILDRGERAELPPMLILQGTADNNVTPAMQERFATAYRARGGVCRLEIFPGMPHERWGAAESERALELIKAFIADSGAAR